MAERAQKLVFSSGRPASPYLLSIHGRTLLPLLFILLKEFGKLYYIFFNTQLVVVWEYEFRCEIGHLHVRCGHFKSGINEYTVGV